MDHQSSIPKTRNGKRTNSWKLSSDPPSPTVCSRPHSSNLTSPSSFYGCAFPALLCGNPGKHCTGSDVGSLLHVSCLTVLSYSLTFALENRCAIFTCLKEKRKTCLKSIHQIHSASPFIRLTNLSRLSFLRI